MILEYAKYGSLHELLSFTRNFSEIACFSVFYQILTSLKEIHLRGIAHMDIKENNILVCHNDNNYNNPLTGNLPIQFKLADFGISVDFRS
jgi:serine/threonine protein kinase